MKLRTTLLGILALILVLIAAAYWDDFVSPRYKGHPLAYWVREVEVVPPQNVRRLTPAAEDAVRAIGPAGIRLYLKWLDYDPNQFSNFRRLRAKFYQMLFGGNAPAEPNPGEGLANGALLAFGILGDKAQDAIPELTHMATNPPSPGSTAPLGALASLANMGAIAVPAYATFFTNQNPNMRRLAARSVIFSAAESPLRGHLKTLLQDTDPAVRSAASNSIRVVMPLR